MSFKFKDYCPHGNPRMLINGQEVVDCKRCLVGDIWVDVVTKQAKEKKNEKTT